MNLAVLSKSYCRALAAFVVLTFLVLRFAGAASAQTQATGTITGTIVDSARKALGGVRVTVASATFSTTVRSASDGTFSVSVAPDTYTVSAAESGFQTSQQEGVTVLAGQSVALKFALADTTLQTIGATTTTRATSLNTSAAASSAVSSQTFIDQGQTQVVNILDQIPGVEINRDSSNEPGANSSISLRGAQPYESQILIDGHPVVTSANGAFGFNSTFVNSLLLGDVEVSEGPATCRTRSKTRSAGRSTSARPTLRVVLRARRSWDTIRSTVTITP